MSTDLHVLLIEDSATDAELILHELKRAGIPFQSKLAETPDAFIRELKTFSPDIILSDFSLPRFNAIEALRLLKEQRSDLPFILVTGSQTEEVAVECMKAGADDYILKQSLKRLPSAVLNSIRKRAAEREKDLAEIRLQARMEIEKSNELLTGMIVHDLRNPLSAAIGYIQIMEMKSKNFDGQMKEYIQRAYDACQRLLEMINQMLDVMRFEDKKMPLKPAIHNLKALIESKTKEYDGAAEANGVTLSMRIPQKSVEAEIDQAIFARVLGNFIVNAIKHTPKGGEITVGFDSPEDDKSVRIWIKDTGEGIPPEYLDRLFQKYGQVEMRKMGRSYDTGLGLVFCRMAVDLHGGKIHVASEVNKGSTFTIELPLRREKLP